MAPSLAFENKSFSLFHNHPRRGGGQISDYCYHDGLQFLTSHAAFNLMMERYLQMIDPKVSLPLWDFMIEAASMGDE